MIKSKTPDTAIYRGFLIFVKNFSLVNQTRIKLKSAANLTINFLDVIQKC